ncbi:ABC transporter substrate-binding protein [Vibrio sp. TRT 21S02]|uniref:ABC transporter substrate-binding protein n=1 Tax=Vibrio sp. TRT 21S02 TaxID=3418507 RepID=UPI003CE962F1
MKFKHGVKALVALTAFTVALPISAIAEETLTIWTWRKQERPLWEAVSKNMKDVDIKVEVFKGVDYNSRLRLGLQSDGGPDLFQGRPGASFIDQYAKAGVIQPVGDAVDLSGISPATLGAATGSDGKVYGVPFAVQTVQIIYNKDIFDKHNLKEPTSLEEFEQVMKTLKAAGVTPLEVPGRAGWALAMMSAGLEAGLSGDGMAKVATRDEPFTAEGYQKVVDTFATWKPYINPSAAAQDYNGMRANVALGDSAMIIDGLWSTSPLSTIAQTNPDAKLGLMPVPGAGGKVYAFADGAYLVNANSPKKSAADKLLAYTATKEFAQLFADHVGELSTYADGITYQGAHQAEAATFVSNQAQPHLTWKGPFNVQYEEVVGPAFQKFLAGKVDSKGLSSEIEKGFKAKNL